MNDYKSGVIYIVTTQKSLIFIKSAIESARSALNMCPNLGRHIYTDKNGLEQIAKLSDSPFSSTGEIINPHYRSKVDYISQTPYERTLYLDSDTRIVADISEMFDLLNRFDIALAHGHKRAKHKKDNSGKLIEKIPESFPQYNSGVILYKNSDEVRNFLKEWADNFHKAGFYKDQIALRYLLYMTKLRLATLPPEYNIRFKKYLKVWNHKEVSPKILHFQKFHQGPFLFRVTKFFIRIISWVKRKAGL